MHIPAGSNIQQERPLAGRFCWMFEVDGIEAAAGTDAGLERTRGMNCFMPRAACRVPRAERAASACQRESSLFQKVAYSGSSINS